MAISLNEETIKKMEKIAFDLMPAIQQMAVSGTDVVCIIGETIVDDDNFCYSFFIHPKAVVSINLADPNDRSEIIKNMVSEFEKFLKGIN